MVHSGGSDVCKDVEKKNEIKKERCEDTEDDIVVNMDGGVGGSWYTNWGSPILGAPADY